MLPLLPLGPELVAASTQQVEVVQRDQAWTAYALEPLGDVDGDGRAELLVSAPKVSWLSSGEPDNRLRSGTGVVRLHSGKHGAVLYTVRGDGLFGFDLAQLPDLDADEVAEFAVGSAHAGGSVHSGRDGKELWRFVALGDPFWCPSMVAGSDDVDGDGCADVLVGSPQASGLQSSDGSVRLLSGRNGELLREWRGDPGSHLGQAIVGIEDVDGDGAHDLASAAFIDQGLHERPARVLVLSASRGEMLWSRDVGEVTGSGVRMALAGDLDLDGVSELLLGLPVEMGGIGRALVLSGRTGKVLRDLVPSIRSLRFGYAVAGGSDLDADGTADLLVCEHGDIWTNAGFATATVFSGADGRVIRELASGFDSDGMGRSAAWIGDIDGDHCPDLALGWLADAIRGSFDGHVQIRSGASGMVLRTLP